MWFPKRFGCVEEWIVIVVSKERCNCSEEGIVAEHLNNTYDRHVPTSHNRDARPVCVIDTCFAN